MCPLIIMVPNMRRHCAHALRRIVSARYHGVVWRDNTTRCVIIEGVASSNTDLCLKHHSQIDLCKNGQNCFKRIGGVRSFESTLIFIVDNFCLHCYILFEAGNHIRPPTGLKMTANIDRSPYYECSTSHRPMITHTSIFFTR